MFGGRPRCNGDVGVRKRVKHISLGAARLLANGRSLKRLAKHGTRPQP